MNKLIAVLAIVALAGCANTGRNNVQADSKAEYDALGLKLQSALKTPALGPIADKVYLGLNVKETPLNLLTLEARPTTEAEKQAISTWHNIRYGDFWKEFDALNVRYYPWIRPFWDLNRTANSTLMAQLYTGEITYADFNRKRMQLAVDTQVAIERRGQEVQQQQAQAAYADAQLRMQASSLAMQNYSNLLRQQNLLNQQMQPARIAPFTCQRYGNTTNCF